MSNKLARTGGAVIIDDGGVKNARRAPAAIRIRTDYKLDGIKKADRIATLSSLTLTNASVDVKGGGVSVKFDWAQVLRFHIGRGASRIAGTLSGADLTITVTDICKEDTPGKVYSFVQGPISDLEITFKNGAKLTWSGPLDEFKLALPNTAPRP